VTEKDFKRSLNLIRYGGIVITVVVFVALLGFSLIVGNALGQNLVSSMLGYIIGFTLATAVLSVVLYFVYRAYLTGRKTS
jgi:hydrogenase/urease accessory protein HupE